MTQRRALLFVPTIEAGHLLQQALKKLMKVRSMILSIQVIVTDSRR